MALTVTCTLGISMCMKRNHCQKAVQNPYCSRNFIFPLQQWLEWSEDKYAALFNSFNDNISGRSFQRRLVVLKLDTFVYSFRCSCWPFIDFWNMTNFLFSCFVQLVFACACWCSVHMGKRNWSKFGTSTSKLQDATGDWSQWNEVKLSLVSIAWTYSQTLCHEFQFL